MLRDEVGFNSSREAFERGAQCARTVVVQQPRRSAVREQGPARLALSNILHLLGNSSYAVSEVTKIPEIDVKLAWCPVSAMPDETNSTAADEILHAAIALQPLIRAARDEIEQGRRLPLHIVDKMKQAGIFGMAMPHEWGGSELDPISQIRVVEAVAAADASVGWCAMINCMGAYSTSFLDQKVARATYFAPEERTFSFQNPTFYRTGGLYTFPFNSISFFRSEDPPWAWRARRLTR